MWFEILINAKFNFYYYGSFDFATKRKGDKIVQDKSNNPRGQEILMDIFAKSTENQNTKLEDNLDNFDF